MLWNTRTKQNNIHLGLRTGNESITKCEMSSPASATSLVYIAIESLKITVCYILKIYLDVYS